MKFKRTLRLLGTWLVVMLVIGGIHLMTSAIPGGADQARAGADQASNDASTTRIGRVVAYDSQNISVLFSSGASYVVFDNIAYLKTYRPILGDYVMVQKYASQWIVMGPMSYNLLQNNAVANPSFELNSVALGSTPPVNWSWYHDPSSTAAVTQVGTQSISSNIIDGTNAAAIHVEDPGTSLTKNSQDELMSDPFVVNAGESWTASAYMQFAATGGSSPGTAIGTAWLHMYYYTSPLDALNASIGSSGFLGVFNFNSSTPDWTLVTALSQSTGTTIPPGANYARVAILSLISIWPNASLYGTLLIDAVTARKLTNSDGTYVH